MSLETLTPNSTRETSGHFAKGNPGGPGNPFGPRLAANREAILGRVGPQEIDALLASLFQRGMAGNIAAAKLVLLYAVGKPEAAKNWEGADESAAVDGRCVPEAATAPIDAQVEEAAGAKPICHGERKLGAKEAAAAPKTLVEPTPEQAAELHRAFDECLRGDKFTGRSPFTRFGDGESREIADILGAKSKNVSVCTGS